MFWDEYTHTHRTLQGINISMCLDDVWQGSIWKERERKIIYENVIQFDFYSKLQHNHYSITNEV